MKPGIPGHYWVRQDYICFDTKQIKPGFIEVVIVCESDIRRKRGLVVSGRGWREFVERTPDHWKWSERIFPPQDFTNESKPGD